MGTVLIALFGIALPFAALMIQLLTGMCDGVPLFDPVPTIWHTALVAFVPLANLLVLVASVSESTRWRGTLLWLNAIAIGISFVYAVAFLPITPFAFIGILFVGIGLLPLSPLCALVCAAVLRKRLLTISQIDNKTTTGSEPTVAPPRPAIASLLLGACLGLLLVAAAEATLALTRVGAMMATSESPGERTSGIWLLRQFGNQHELLRMCYSSGSHTMSGYLFPSPFSTEHAQKVFYRVTGKPYNSLPRPVRVFRGARVDSEFDFDFDFDPDLGGQNVGGRRRGLSLDSSRIDAKLHGDAAVSYLEWTMVFKNNHPNQREARAQVLLPPGGVVSRVSLWVNGEPREAAFAGSAQVREAYQKVAVRQRRDPLLVTWAGTDRVLVQCFPVPEYGEMQIRLGITTPLELPAADKGVLFLPSFAERNFSITSEEIHSVWVESDQPFGELPEEFDLVSTGDRKHAAQGLLSNADLASHGGRIEVTRSPTATISCTADPQEEGRYILQSVIRRASPGVQRVAVVVDGSIGMADHFDAVAQAIAGLPAKMDVCLFVAADEVVELSEIAADRDAATLAEALREAASPGGCDNVPALWKAYRTARSGETAVVWVHAAQPVVLSPVGSMLSQWIERRGETILYDVPVESGPNRILDAMNPTVAAAAVQHVRCQNSLAATLGGLFERLDGKKEFRLVWKVTNESLSPLPKASSHVVRLWAADRIAKLAGRGSTANRSEAVSIAGRYQLVTPVSGAVVLETKQQYEASNLEPADPDTTPNVPEPAILVLLLSALPIAGWLGWRRRRRP